jgi:hypothetical protein
VIDWSCSGLRINEPVVRMVAVSSHSDAARLRFTYRGRTAEDVPLASGQIRRQVGLKLRAVDGCNLVYVMWRIDPTPGLEVSAKVNPGMHTSDDCGSNGYVAVSPGVVPLVPLVPGIDHVLEARISGLVITVFVDDVLVWQGALPDSARWLSGPAGIRTDNVVIDAELMTVPGPVRIRSSIPGC